MSKRSEFPAKIKAQEWERSCGKCRACGLAIGSKAKHYDHILPDALGGKPTLANCQLLCEPCHKEKTGKYDVPRVRKADRQHKADIGAKAAPIRSLQSRGFELSCKAPRIDKAALPQLERKALFR